jgi:hypothetical protein
MQTKSDGLRSPVSLGMHHDPGKGLIVHAAAVDFYRVERTSLRAGHARR